MSLAAMPFLLIPYDSLTHLLGLDPGETSQTLPVTAVFSLAYIALRQGRLRFTPTSKSVFLLLSFACAYILGITAVNLLLEATGFLVVDVDLHVGTAIRQGASLALGFSSFLMFQDALIRLGWQTAFRWIVIGGLPSLTLCFLQLLAGNFRVQGFSSEPSHLGDMLVLAFLPACFFASLQPIRRAFALVFGATALLTSFSGTAYLKSAFAVFSFSAARGKALRGLAIATITILLIYAVLLLYPDNYIFILIGLFRYYLESGNLIGGSFIDRFFGLVGPLSMLDSIHGWLGFGLGGDSAYFDRMFDADTADAIRAEKTGVPSISSLQAKMLLYGGVPGEVLYLCAWWVAWRSCPKQHPARFLIPTVFAASLFSLGPLFLPYVWLWLAFGSTTNLVPSEAVLGAPGSAQRVY
jgi:hypothetical protein